MRTGKFLLLASLGFGLSACAQLHNEAMNATSSGPAFNDALFKQYQKLAKMEADEQDWLDAEFFGERALATAGDNAPDPQGLDARDLPKEHVSSLTGARNQLTAALEVGAREQFPKAAAEAQAGFDCWLQEAEENIQPSDVQWCKDLFLKGMNAMDVQPVPLAKVI